MEIKVVPIQERYADGFHACLDAVAREKKYLAMQEAPPMENVLQFVRENVEGDLAQFLALEGERVVGWCDAIALKMGTFQHTATVGMGLLKDFRGRGIGRRMLESTIAKAFGNGIERIELTVYDSNLNAIGLYRKLGFREEGKMIRKAKIDGAYHDLIVMALFKDPGLAPRVGE
jgi:RimJ/RimL family protein N-acetyltransferase